MNCQCSDPGCPVCKGSCGHRAITSVLRVDIEDKTGTPMCRACAGDAMESGLFNESVTVFLKYWQPIRPKAGELREKI
jgi:hypothetical protein